MVVNRMNETMPCETPDMPPIRLVGERIYYGSGGYDWWTLDSGSMPLSIDVYSDGLAVTTQNTIEYYARIDDHDLPYILHRIQARRYDD